MIDYIPSKTGLAFHNSDKFVKMICGPYGSGKSCCCAMDVLYYACAQAPDINGIRYSRVGVIRSTFRELINTTRKSLMEVLPDECGTITMSTATSRGYYVIPLKDGTTVNLELELVGIESVQDCQKILSSNWSYAWINEATGLVPEAFATILTRIGRYPKQVSWGGLLMDFNQPVHGTWLYEYMHNPEPNWLVLQQPPAAFKKETEDGKVWYEVNGQAENLENLGSSEEGDPDGFPAKEKGKRYYQNQINALLKQGRTDIVENQYCMLDVPIVDGKPVYTNFKHGYHVADYHIEPRPFGNIVIGMDQSGIHPAAVIMQYIDSKWCILDEIYAAGEGFENFINGMLIPLLREKYATNPVTAAIDPSNTRDSWQAITPKQRLEEVGIETITDISNNPKLRIQCVDFMLNQATGGILIDPRCDLVIRGFVHEYRYRKMNVSGTIGTVFTPTPEKNDASHVHDAIQYACMFIQQGGGKANISDLAKNINTMRKTLGGII